MQFRASNLRETIELKSGIIKIAIPNKFQNYRILNALSTNKPTKLECIKNFNKNKSCSVIKLYKLKI